MTLQFRASEAGLAICVAVFTNLSRSVGKSVTRTGSHTTGSSKRKHITASHAGRTFSIQRTSALRTIRMAILALTGSVRVEFRGTS